MTAWPEWFVREVGVEEGDEPFLRLLAERCAGREEHNAQEALSYAVPDSGLFAPMLKQAMEHRSRAAQLRAALAGA